MLFRDAQAVVFCADHAEVAEALRAQGIDQRATMLGWSRERSGWLHVVREEPSAIGQHFHVINDAVDFDFEIPFSDRASAENAIHCVALMLHLGRTPQWIAERTPQLPPVSMRLEAVEGIHGITLLNDAYSNDTASLAIALDHLDALAAGRPKAVVLSDLTGGEEPEQRYRRVEELLKRTMVQAVFTIGPELRSHALPFAPRVEHFSDAQ